MQRLLLYRNGQRILGTTGLMHVDGRLGMDRIKDEVRKRNKTVEKNFPHEVSDSFYKCDKRLNEVGSLIRL